MQIHELTNKRKPQVNEILGGLASVAAQNISNKVNSAAGVSTQFAPGQTTQTGAGAQLAAGGINKQFIDSLSKKMQGAWLKQTLPTLMSAAQATEPAGVNQADQIEELTNIVNGMLKFDYTNPHVDPEAQGGRAATEAKQRSADIAQIINSITTHPAAGSGNTKSTGAYDADFYDLAEAMAALMSLSMFQPGSGQAQAGGAVDPIANQGMLALGVSAADLAKFAALAKKSGQDINPTGNPMIDAVLRAGKILKK